MNWPFDFEAIYFITSKKCLDSLLVARILAKIINSITVLTGEKYMSIISVSNLSLTPCSEN